MNAPDYEKELLRHKIATQRKLSSAQFSSLKRMATPAIAAGTLGRLAGGRLGHLSHLSRLARVVGLFAKGPRLKTWMRVAAVATLVVPLIVPFFSRARSQSGVTATADQAAAE